MNDPLRILVVDDEPLAIDRLCVLLARSDGAEVVATAGTGQSALDLVDDLKPDLCLLDIGMPEMDGISLARSLAQTSTAPRVIFVTAFDNFAVAAFGIDAVDYLVKPVDPPRLEQALAKARRHTPAERRPTAAPVAYVQEFWASDRHGLVRVATSDITRVTAERDYMRLHAGQRSWLINDSLTRLEEQLDPTEFVRLHRGAIIRRAHVVGLRYDDGWVACLADGTEQRVGRAYADNARRLANRA